jgi:hypothetical protein
VVKTHLNYCVFEMSALLFGLVVVLGSSVGVESLKYIMAASS